MRAAIGDKIVVLGHHVGARQRQRSAVILAVGEGGHPPYFVRWEDGHESTFTPGLDTVVEHYPAVMADG
jgi:hypothetical protein